MRRLPIKNPNRSIHWTAFTARGTCGGFTQKAFTVSSVTRKQFFASENMVIPIQLHLTYVVTMLKPRLRFEKVITWFITYADDRDNFPWDPNCSWKWSLQCPTVAFICKLEQYHIYSTVDDINGASLRLTDEEIKLYIEWRLFKLPHIIYRISMSFRLSHSVLRDFMMALTGLPRESSWNRINTTPIAMGSLHIPWNRT